MIPETKSSTTQSFELYLQTLEGRNYSPESIRAYKSDINQFLEWLKTRRVDWDIPYRIQRIDIVNLINTLANKKSTGGTRKRKLAALRSFFKFMKDQQIIYGNPTETIEGPLLEEKEPEILHKIEYKALLQVASGNARDYAIIMAFLQTGMRVSELCDLTLQQLDLEEKTITVRQGKGKKDRVIPLEPQVIDALKKWLKERKAGEECATVFVARNGTSMDPRTVRYRIQKYYKEAGIKKKASVHTLRHTFGTHKIHNGMKLPLLKDVLGHKNLQTTYKYVHLDRTNLRQEMVETAL